MTVLAALLLVATTVCLLGFAEAFQVGRSSTGIVSTTTRPLLGAASSTAEVADEKECGDRRKFLVGAAASFLGATTLPFAHVQPSNAASSVDYKAVSADVADLIKKNPE